MRVIRLLRGLVAFFCVGLEQGVFAQSSPLSDASWIWADSSATLCHFRKTFTLANDTKAVRIFISVDNGYELYFNGAFIGSDIGPETAVWQSVESYDVSTLARNGSNVVAVRGSDLGGQAGLLSTISFESNDGRGSKVLSDNSWRVSPSTDPTGFAQIDYVEDGSWSGAKVIGKNGCPPWGMVSTRGPNSPNVLPGSNTDKGFREASEDFSFPSELIFVRGRLPESTTAGAPQCVWRIGSSRAYFEMDTLGPSMPGRALVALKRSKDGYAERELFRAGLIGSPSVSHNGRTVFFSHLPAGEKFWRVYRMSLADGRGRKAEALTSGAFHDFDPEPLPDGRLVFSSTRIGNREEYHGNFARSLFVMEGDGSNIRPITHHIVGDMEPKLTAEGNIAFIRQDNFMERAKVETHIHSVRPDGTAGQVLLGPERGALNYNSSNAAEENGLWLRSFGFGSPAPLPDGRVAALSSVGLVISGNSIQPHVRLRPALELVDISPVPDGRLLCTIAGHSGIGVLDVEKNEITRIYSKPPFDLHSVVFAGARPAPPIARSSVDAQSENISLPSGFLLGQNVFQTKQQNADIARVKAIRVIEGRPFTTRSARHPYDHLGVEARELGTVPLAPDGSFYVEVPADRALSIQAVDGEGRSIVNELSWIYVRPGEQRSCIGCHSQRDAAPLNTGGILALRSGPVKLLGKGEPNRFRGNNAANGGVLNLQFDRMREVASINGQNAFGCAEKQIASRQDLVRSVVASLRSDNVEQRISAAQRLGLLREKSAAPGLADSLRDEAFDVRMNVALALASCGTRESVPSLLRALNDEPFVSQAANLALRTLTAHSVEYNAFAPKQEREAAGVRWEHFFQTNHWLDIERSLLNRLARDCRINRGGEVENVLNALGHVGSQNAAAVVRAFVLEDRQTNLRSSLAAIRALGNLRDVHSVQLVGEILQNNGSLRTNNALGDHEFGWTQAPVQIAAAAAEALGRIGSSEAEEILLRQFAHLSEFWGYSFQTADHDWLMGCHSSPVHYRILEALDRIGSTKARRIAAEIIQSVPIDPDRALLFENDAYETVVARLLTRAGMQRDIVDSCIAILRGEQVDSPLRRAVSASPPAVSVLPMGPQTRAAQILAIVAGANLDAQELRRLFKDFRAQPASRTRSWTCFYLARALGNHNDKETVQALSDALQNDAPETSGGLLDPPNVFVYDAMTPFYRAAAAASLGRIGDPSATAALLCAVQNFQNAIDVRNAAAHTLAAVATAESARELRAFGLKYPEISTRRLLLEASERARSQKVE